MKLNNCGRESKEPILLCQTRAHLTTLLKSQKVCGKDECRCGFTSLAFDFDELNQFIYQKLQRMKNLPSICQIIQRIMLSLASLS